MYLSRGKLYKNYFVGPLFKRFENIFVVLVPTRYLKSYDICYSTKTFKQSC